MRLCTHTHLHIYVCMHEYRYSTVGATITCFKKYNQQNKVYIAFRTEPMIMNTNKNKNKNKNMNKNV